MLRLRRVRGAAPSDTSSCVPLRNELTQNAGPTGAPEAHEEGSQTCNVWNASDKYVGASETREESLRPFRARALILSVPDVARLATFSPPLRGDGKLPKASQAKSPLQR